MNVVFKRKIKKHAHDQQQIVVVAESGLIYDQHHPSDAAHVLGLETFFCQVLSEVTGDGLWLCDLTTQIITGEKINKKKEKNSAA